MKKGKKSLALKAIDSFDDNDENLDKFNAKEQKMKWLFLAKSFKGFLKRKEIEERERLFPKKKIQGKIE